MNEWEAVGINVRSSHFYFLKLLTLNSSEQWSVALEVSIELWYIDLCDW